MRYEEGMEAAGESPLDVLSRAASMVQGQEIEELRRRAAQRALGGGGGSSLSPSSSQDRRSPTKDLPTRQWKVERSESRRHDPLTGPKMRVKREDSSASYSDEGGAAGGADGPLDMTVRRGSPPPYRAAVSPSGRQLGRPSVITCGPGRSDSEDAGSDGDLRPDELRTREVIKDFPGVCDPVIDEHFRRSLGKHYASLFKSSSTPSPPQAREEDVTGMSVDDHFAKALGDTWIKLQEKDQSSSDQALPLVT
ncbi:transcription cofactor vestigial-like protein 4 isoform X1 [Amphibalanus amphitrite]|uniref:transcription cofactor vestigial-like protein 4 isoform X1 n=1 Tax=Amphibalanus amphitrite TaxID=1232801 RepID=UPI001C9113D3|nr:transcription cofactor vestigial-like protein 4 isoform X1 [Amphibalanus amphitrite]